MHLGIKAFVPRFGFTRGAVMHTPWRRALGGIVYVVLAGLIVVVVANGSMPGSEKLVVVYGLCAWGTGISSVISFAMAIGLLVALPVLSITPYKNLSDAVAVCVYYLLVIGVVSAIVELRYRPQADAAEDDKPSEAVALAPGLAAAEVERRQAAAPPWSDISVPGAKRASRKAGALRAAAVQKPESLRPGGRIRPSKVLKSSQVAVSVAQLAPQPPTRALPSPAPFQWPSWLSMAYRIVVFPLIVMAISGTALLTASPYVQPYIDGMLHHASKSDVKQYEIKSTPQATPKPAVVKPKSQLRVMVANGNGVAGSAKIIAGQLSQQGYVLGAADVANADKFSYAQTEIHCHTGGEAGAGEIAGTLKSSHPRVVTDLASTSPYDYVVITGQAQ